jgi:hypothetical protein
LSLVSDYVVLQASVALETEEESDYVILKVSVSLETKAPIELIVDYFYIS